MMPIIKSLPNVTVTDPAAATKWINPPRTNGRFGSVNGVVYARLSASPVNTK